MEKDLQSLIEEVARLIVGRGNIVAFSGSGVSKESGIPTFRDPGGLWDRFEPGGSSGIMGIISANPQKAIDLLEELLETFRKARPNAGHYALAELEDLGFLKSVITQNIDNLHHEAGNTVVFELHGSIYRLRCLGCGKKIRRTREAFLSDFEDIIAKVKERGLASFGALMRRCECGGMLRPDFVAFGEAVQELQESIDAAVACRLMLVLGTSGVVYPAASLPAHAKEAGAIVVEVNPERSALTRLADFWLQGPSGELLPRLVEEVRRQLQ